MKCFKCGKSAADGTNLYRQNEKGVAGIWACAPHSKPVEQELVHIVAQLQQAQKGLDDGKTGSSR